MLLCFYSIFYVLIYELNGNFEKQKKLINLILVITLLLVVIAIQFILGRKQLEYGFFIDDWDNLAAYKMHVTHPIFGLLDAWKILGSHRFAHVYYIGILFDFFQYNYLFYNITNQFLKALSAFSLFPVIYLLFKNKFIATLATLLYVIHFSPYGTLDDVSRGEDFLVVIFMDLFLAFYIYFTQKQIISLKKMIILLILLLTTIFFDPSRAFPLVLMLPLLELLNFWFNRPSASIKSSILRLIFFYSPFIIILLLSPGSILSQVGYYKGLWEMIRLGNFQLFLIPFASLGSTFIPIDLQNTLFGNLLYQDLGQFTSSLSGKLIIFGFIATAIGFFTNSSPKKFLLQTMFLSIFFFFIAFIFANNWIHMDNKFRASVDPSTFLISSLVGLFIFSTAVSFFKGGGWK